MMEQIARITLAAGIFIALIAAVLWVLARLGFRPLPGDIVVEGERFSFYFPIVTCLVISLLLTLAAWLWHWLSR